MILTKKKKKGKKLYYYIYVHKTNNITLSIKKKIKLKLQNYLFFVLFICLIETRLIYYYSIFIITDEINVLIGI